MFEHLPELHRRIVFTKDDESLLSPGFKEAMEDARQGRVTQYESSDDLFNKLGIIFSPIG